jgi:hypothetical protein
MNADVAGQKAPLHDTCAFQLRVQTGSAASADFYQQSQFAAGNRTCNARFECHSQGIKNTGRNACATSHLQLTEIIVQRLPLLVIMTYGVLKTG